MSIKVEEVDEYDGSYVCVICSESVRGDDSLCCSQCSSNPFHARCVVGTAFAETCPQCAGRTVVPWTGAKIPAATSSAPVDLTGSEPLLTEMDVHEGVGRWVYSGGLVVSSDGTWRPYSYPLSMTTMTTLYIYIYIYIIVRNGGYIPPLRIPKSVFSKPFFFYKRKSQRHA